MDQSDAVTEGCSRSRCVSVWDVCDRVCMYMGKTGLRFWNSLRDNVAAAENRRILKGELVWWAMQVLPVSVQRGNAELYCRSGLGIS